MSTVTLEFKPMAELPDEGFVEAVLRGGEMNDGVISKPYDLVSAWRDGDGRWWVDRMSALEIVDPQEWAALPPPLVTTEQPRNIRPLF